MFYVSCLLFKSNVVSIWYEVKTWIAVGYNKNVGCCQKIYTEWLHLIELLVKKYLKPFICVH